MTRKDGTAPLGGQQTSIGAQVYVRDTRRTVVSTDKTKKESDDRLSSLMMIEQSASEAEMLQWCETDKLRRVYETDEQRHRLDVFLPTRKEDTVREMNSDMQKHVLLSGHSE